MAKAEYIIRNERPADWREVEELTRRAFWNLHSPGCDEHYLAHIMRGHEDFIPELDLVIEEGGRLTGNIMYTRARLEGPDGALRDTLTFGPVSILPEYQRMGRGRALIERSFDIALKLGFDSVVIFGHPCNYIPLGFISSKKRNIHLEGGVFPAAMLVRELKPDALPDGDWIYRESPVYSFDEADAREFDKLFPPAEKGYRQSQEEFYIYSHSRLT